MLFLGKSVRFEHVGLLLIVLLGLFLYLYKLDTIPAGFYVDEALTGYNAYSFLTTGKDEYGKAFPVALRFLGSYTPPLYTYFTIPAVFLLGLNIISVRVVSVVAGALGVVVVFYFLKSLRLTKSGFAPVLGAFLFAVSPWTIFFSRVGYEMNLAFFIFSLGALAGWIGIKKPKFLLLAFPLLSISTYAAHTQKFLAPLFIIALLILFRKELFAKRSLRFLIYGLLIAFIIQIPNLLLLQTPAFYTKKSLFYKGAVMNQAEKINTFLPMGTSVLLAFLREFFSQFLNYFSPRSLFFLPDPNLQRSMPELAVFYHWMVVPYLVGLYVFWKNKKKAAFKYVFLLAVVAPLPTAFVGDPFSSQRALPLLLPLILIIAVGMDKLIYKKPVLIWASVFLLLIASSFLLLWRSYFVFLPKERAKVWGYGFEQLAEEVKRRPDEWFVIDQTRIKPAYIQLTFFLQYPPEEFQARVDKNIKDNYYTKTEFDPHYKFANIETRNIDWEEDIYKKQILVGDELTISPGQADEHFLDKVFEIKDPLENIVFVGFETNPELKCAHISNKNIHCKK